MVAQTGRFSHAFVSAGPLGKGGFGRVHRAFHGPQRRGCAVKVIPANLREGETIEDHNDVWSGPDVFQRLRHLSSPHILRYYDYWLEEKDPLAAEHSSVLCLSVDEEGIAKTEADSVDSLRWREEQATNSIFSDPSTVSSVGSDVCEWEVPPTDMDVPGKSRDAFAERNSIDNARASSRTAQMFLLVHMELCEGTTLWDWLHGEHAPAVPTASGAGLRSALDIGIELFEGLAAIHEVGIVHRDIKPGNLIIDAATGHLRIFDFGLSRLCEENLGDYERKDSSEDSMAMRRQFSPKAVGTPGYASPEQCNGGSPHPSADIFSSGIVLLEVLMAALNPPGHSSACSTAMGRAAVLQHIRGGVIDSPAELLALPLQLRLLLAGGLLHTTAAARPTAREAVDELKRIASSLC